MVLLQILDVEFTSLVLESMTEECTSYFLSLMGQPGFGGYCSLV